jgi:hypothetical protein
VTIIVFPCGRCADVSVSGGIDVGVVVCVVQAAMRVTITKRIIRFIKIFVLHNIA